MFRKFRDSKSIRVWSIVISFTILLQIVAPTTVFALTGGASQPEVNSFTPIGTSDMVDPFSGGFNYNIPLMDVGGHPINLSYNGAPTMDQEATMVGLGWSLNAAGQINRSLRGIPDDFKGGRDRVTQENNMRKNWTFGMATPISPEVFGFKLPENGPVNLRFNFGINYNNYNGISISSSASVSLDLTKGSASGSLGLSATNSSSGGLSLSPSLSFSQKIKNEKNIDNSFATGLNLGATFNSRQGLSSVSVAASASGASKKEIAAMTRQEGDKEDKGGLTGRSLSGSVSISMMNNTYVPNLDLPRTTTSMSGNFKLGAALFGLDADATFSVNYSEQELATKVRAFPAYGTAYEEYGVGKSNAMLDFNREKQRAFSRNIPDLHTTNHTYDLFSISGQGVGGMFRSFRSEVGYVHDNRVADFSTGDKVSLEVAVGNAADNGLTGGVTSTTGASGNWNNDNAAKGKLNHQKKQTNNAYEPFYFKHTGEITVDNEMQDNSSSLFSRSGGFEPVRLGVYAQGYTHRVQPVYQGKGIGNSKIINENDNKRANNTRAKRNQIITTLTNSEARNFGIEHNQPHQNKTGRDHHFSEMTVLQNNGARYVYGIPAYNTLEKDVSFNVVKKNAAHLIKVNPATGLIEYEPTENDNTPNNKNGRDHYFSRTTLPPYAHSYLLTAVLSHDYVDRRNDGVTKDDYGSFTKFNYGETADLPTYKWRVPYNKDEANYSEGLKTDPGDDKGNYVYGEKELWYLDNIETKTHIAVMHMSSRRDGYGVIDENGGLGGEPMQQLDKISLYARPDFYLVDGVTPNPNKTPIKEVHFEYDYSLCQGIPNHKPAPNSDDNQKGKLTLKRVYFTYANSYKGALSDYQFVYADPNHDGTMEANYPYDLKAVNAWGGYQEQVADADFAVAKGLLNSEYPYVDQNPDLNQQDPKNYFKKQTQYVNAWALTSIKLPSGGRIDVDLEPHEYAYVQDQEALQMYTVLGCNNSKNDYSTAEGKLYGGAGNLHPNNYLHLAVSKGTTKEQLFKNLLKGKPLYYRFLVDLTNGLDADNGSYEYVEGYLSKDLIDKDNNKNVDSDGDGDKTNDNNDGGCGININSGGYTTAWIRIKSVPTNNDGGALNPRNSHPIAKSAWQFARMYAPKKAFDQPDPQEGAKLIDIAKLLTSQVTNIAELFTGANGLLRAKGYGKAFNSQKSWIRLNTPNQHKLGGGCRVAAIKMYDNWELMSEKSDDNLDGFDHDFEYGQTYKYTLEDGTSSSGVATYEPLGAKDNPLIQPVYFTEEHLLVPDGKHYMEKPYGESFYPGPSIGYSRVEVANLSREDVKKHATGKMVHDFYTCRDYPVKVGNTGLFSDEKRTNILGQILKISSRNYAVASQGFVIKTNDMHGKQKAQRVYAEGQLDPISGTKYVYGHNFSNVAPNTGDDLFPSLNANTTKLNNNVNVITPEGKLETKQIGVDFDMINDFGENRTDMVDINIDGNLAVFIVGIFPGFVPTVLPRVATEKTRYRYAATTKVINRFGILREVIAYDLGAAVSTRNKAWDSETGEVLLTETTNEYGDKVFNFNYPAHWYYKGMGQAYQNIGMDVEFTAVDGIISAIAPLQTLSAYNHLYPGDEIAVGTTKYWIEDDGAGLKVIDAEGQPKSGVIKGKIIRSGHRNRQALSIGKVTMLNDPLADANGTAYPKGTPLPLLKRTSTINEEAVVNTSINEFSEDWIQNYCNCDLDITTTYNSYVQNSKGTWRLKKAHLYLVGRAQTTIKNAREEGVYSRYNTFWKIPGNKWVKNNQNYTWSSQVSKYSPYGFELENQDRLGRYSAAQYDYNNNLPTAVANNARYSDIGFDGFEEYDFDKCSNDHFSFEGTINGVYTIDDNTSHTGRRSFKLNPGESATLEKDLLNCSPANIPN